MFNRLRIILLCLAFTIPPYAWGQNQQTDIRPLAHQLVGDELLKAIEGQTHDGSYNFDIQGLASQFYEETHHADSRLTYRESGQVYKGAWIIDNDSLCFFYDDPGINGGCYRVYRIRNCYYFYNKFRPYVPDEPDRPYWTARSVIKGDVPECEAAVS